MELTNHSRRTVTDFIFDINLANGRYTDPRNLCRFDAKVYSQHGQDGWIAEIFRRIGGPTNRYFVEIGVEDGTECNTRLLLESGWTGVWIDGDAAKLTQALHNFNSYVASGKLQIVQSFVTAETINATLDAVGVPAEIDFLSVDTDMNTSHIWRAINRRERVADIEYNASLPASVALEVPYDPTGVWRGPNWFGASLKTLEQIATAKGLSLVGCELTAADAFFVRDASDAVFQAPFTAENHWEPCRFDRDGHRGHPNDRQARRYDVR